MRRQAADSDEVGSMPGRWCSTRRSVAGAWFSALLAGALMAGCGDPVALDAKYHLVLGEDLPCVSSHLSPEALSELNAAEPGDEMGVELDREFGQAALACAD